MGNYVSGPNIMQPVHNITAPPALSQPPPPAPQLMSMGPIMQQRPDCRLAPIVPPVSGPSNSGVAYPSCMVSGSSHASHMEQTSVDGVGRIRRVPTITYRGSTSSSEYKSETEFNTRPVLLAYQSPPLTPPFLTSSPPPPYTTMS